MSDTGDVRVGFAADPADFDRLAVMIEGAISSGFQKGFTEMKSLMDRNKAIIESFKKIQDAQAKAFNPKIFQAAIDQLDKFQTATAKMALSFKELGLSAGVAERQVSQDTKRQAAEANARNLEVIQQNVNIRLAAKETAQAQAASLQEGLQSQRAALDAEGRVQKASLEEQIALTQSAAKERVAITRGVVETVVNLEKQLATAIGAIFETTRSVISSVAGGIRDVFGKALSGVASLFKSSDAEINSSFASSMSERNTLVSESYSRQTETIRENTARQTAIVREGVTRQAAAIEELRAASSTGVTGSVKNLALGAGFLGIGIAAVQAIKSTFGVGGDFVRGLAVLQAQLGLTADQMKVVRQESIDLGNDISLPGVSALDAAQAIAILTKQFGSLGVHAVEAAEAAAKGTLQLSRAAGVGAEDAAAVIGAAVNVFGVSADKAVAVADQIAGALTKAAGVSFADFSAAFRQGAATFKTFVEPAEGATGALNDFNASLAVLAKNGVVGGYAGAAIKTFFLNANRGTDAVNSAVAKLVDRAGETGTLFFDANGKARQFSDTLQILRKGLVGLTDEQKNNTLQTLFGSRGITAANALINISAKDYADLKNAIMQQGLAAKIAAAQNTGFKGALDALGSVVETIQILFYEKINPALGKATLWIANLANEIFFGNGAWSAFRDAVKGAAIALGLIIAAKAAVEVIQLIGLAAAAATSPMALLVGGIVAIGAAIGYFAPRSLALRDALGKVRDVALEVGGAIKDFAVARFGDLAKFVEGTVLPALGRLVNWFTGTAIPAIERFGSFIGEHLVSAFQATVRFVTGTAIPALERFGSMILDVVVPAAEAVGKAAQHWFGVAVDAVQGFWAKPKPVLQPAIDGFIAFGKIIAGLFDHFSFGDLGSAFGAAGKGIAGAATNIGKVILDALKPIGEHLFDVIKGVFTAANFHKLSKGFLDLVEWVGKFLGSHVDFITEWAAKIALVLGAAAVIIGGKFAIGFVKGLGESLPRLLGDIAGQIPKLLFNPNVIMLAIGAAFAVSKLIGIFRGLGTGGGEGFLSGFKTAVSNKIDFYRAFFGGNESVATTASKRSFDAVYNQARDYQNKLRALGSDTQLFDESGNLALTTSSFRDAKSELRNLTRGLTDAQVAGLQFRDKMTQYFQGLGQLLSGGGGIVKGVGQIIGSLARLGGDAFMAPLLAAGKGLQKFFGVDSGDTAGEGFVSAFRGRFAAGISSIRDGFSQALNAFRDTARNTGQSIGSLLGEGIKTGAMAGLAALGGFQAGKSEGASGGNGVLSALTAGLTGTVLAGPGVGAIAGGAALLGAAFGKASKAAQDEKKRIDDLAATISGNLEQALKDGTLKVLTFKDALASGATGPEIGTAIVNQLSEGAASIIHQAHVSVKDILDSIGNKDFTGIRDALIKAAGGLGGLDAGFVDKAFTQTGKGTLDNTLPDNLAKARDAYHEITDAALSYAKAIDLTVAKQGILGTQAAGATSWWDLPTAAATKAAAALAAFQAATQAVRNQVGSALDPSAVRTSADAVTTAVNDVTSSITHYAGEAARASKNPIKPSVDTAAIQTALGDLNGALDAVNQSLDEYQQNFADAFGLSGTFQQTVAQGVQSIASAVTTLGSIDISKGIVEQAAAQGQKDTIAKAIADTIAAGIKDGSITGLDSAKAETYPLYAAGLEAIYADPNTTDAQKKALADQLAAIFNDGFAAAGPSITAAAGTAGAAAEQGLKNATAATVLASLALGVHVGAGLAKGITASTPAIVAAAKAAALAAAKAAQDALDVHSPSRVMYQIGTFAGQGLANGLADSTTGIGAVISNAVDDVIGKAQDAADRIHQSLQATFLGLFNVGVGSSNQLGANFTSTQLMPNAIGGITSAINGILTSVEGTASSIWSATVAANKTGKDYVPLTPDQQRLVGANPFSLDPTNTIGVSNLQNITAAFDAVGKLGQGLLQQGLSPEQVVATLSGYVAQVENAGVAMGFNKDELDALTASLGLDANGLQNFVDATDAASVALAAAQQAIIDAATTVDAFGDKILKAADGLLQITNAAGQVIVGGPSSMPWASQGAQNTDAINKLVAAAVSSQASGGPNASFYLSTLFSDPNLTKQLGLNLPDNLKTPGDIADYVLHHFGPEYDNDVAAIKKLRGASPSDAAFLAALSDPQFRPIIDFLLGQGWSVGQAAYAFLHDDTYKPDNSTNPEDSAYRPDLGDVLADQNKNNDSTSTPPADQHLPALANNSTQVYNIYPPTADVHALALDLANKQAQAAYVG